MDEVDSTEPALSVRAQVWATEKHLKKKKNHLVKNILIKDRQKSSTSTLQIGRKQATGKCGRVTDEGGRRRSCTDLHQRVSPWLPLRVTQAGWKNTCAPSSTPELESLGVRGWVWNFYNCTWFWCAARVETWCCVRTEWRHEVPCL